LSGKCGRAIASNGGGHRRRRTDRCYYSNKQFAGNHVAAGGHGKNPGVRWDNYLQRAGTLPYTAILVETTAGCEGARTPFWKFKREPVRTKVTGGGPQSSKGTMKIGKSVDRLPTVGYSWHCPGKAGFYDHHQATPFKWAKSSGWPGSQPRSGWASWRRRWARRVRRKQTPAN